ncbi:TPA: hypothetical protein ACF0RA_002339 [Enterococcus hirae]
MKKGMFNFISDQANMGLSFDNLEKTDFIPLSEEKYFREWEFIDLLFDITGKLLEQLEKRKLSEKNDGTRQFNRDLAVEYIQFMEKSIVDYFHCHNIQLIDDADTTDYCILTEFDKKSQAFEHYLDDFEKIGNYKYFISRFRHIIIEWWMPTLQNKSLDKVDKKEIKIIKGLLELYDNPIEIDRDTSEELKESKDHYRTKYISNNRNEKDLIFPLDKKKNLEFKEEIYKYLTKPGYRKR